MRKYLLSIGLILGLISCTSSSSGAKELRLAIPEDPMTLDPRKGGDALSSTLHFFLYEGLLLLQPDGSVSPGQCASYTLSEDALVYTFTIQENYWSDGSLVTSFDFASSLQAILSPFFPSPNAHLLYPIQGAQKAKQGLIPVSDVAIFCPDAKTLVFHLETPTPYFLELLSFCVFSPYKPHPQPGHPPLSNGPFVLEKWTAQNSLRLRKNPYYRGNNPPKLDTITLQIIGSETTALQLYQQGQIDLIGEPFSAVPAESLSSIPPEEKFSVPVNATTILAFQSERFPFSHPKLRKALALAIDKTQLVQQVLVSGEKEAHRLIPPLLSKIAEKYPAPDLPQARALLEEFLQEMSIDRQALSKHLSYLYTRSQINHAVAQVIQEQWKQSLGLHVPLIQVEKKTLLDKLNKKDFSIAEVTLRAQYADPISFLERFSYPTGTKNYPGWKHPLFLQILQRSSQERGLQRLTSLQEAEQLLLEEYPIVPLFHLHFLYAKKPYIDGVQTSPAGGIFFERLCIP